ncbi:MAG: hypothetical protein A2Y13_04435 [Planctomycetes bacterium GWC2_45_44]|nr:MAG: hypothetical protein A2Y13_04435 [Planctomycetes bacterium GWC2_45_44]HBR19427.1 hypothetical protein [Phycisphaerales bacterium]
MKLKFNLLNLRRIRFISIAFYLLLSFTGITFSSTPAQKKTARIACMSIPPGFSREFQDVNARLKWTMNLIDEAALDKPDIICLPEIFAQLHIPELQDVNEPLFGTIFTTIAKKAKEHRCYIVCPVLARENGNLSNAAILIDRQGKCVGVYRKYMPTMSELDIGIKPGTEFNVFETDFGKIGIVICFDLNFIDIGKAMKDQGVKLIFFPSMWEGGLHLQRWALELQCYMASAVLSGRTSKIISPLGKILVVGSDYQPVIFQDVNLDFEVCHIDRNIEKIKAVKAKYGDKAVVDIATTEGRLMIASNVKGVSTKDLISEFSLERLDDYYKKSRNLRDETLNQSQQKQE